VKQTEPNLGKASVKNKSHRRTRSPRPVNIEPNPPLDALVRGLASIGERFVKGGPAQLRIP
jgi:hypothetical protein